MDMEEMLRKAQEAAETIQKQMGEAQAKLDSLEVEGVSGGGLVKIRCTAKGRLLGVSIDDSLIVREDKHMREARQTRSPAWRCRRYSKVWACRRDSICPDWGEVTAEAVAGDGTFRPFLLLDDVRAGRERWPTSA